MVKAMEESYAEGVTDEFIKPIVHVENGKPVAVIEEGDVVIFFKNSPSVLFTFSLSNKI